MPSSTREIKRRIKSVGNIKQITKAMQLVATSKMKRAQKSSQDADFYAYGALEILENVTRLMESKSELVYWQENLDSATILLILITTDRGFCAGLNVALLSKVLGFIKELQSQGLSLQFITIGKKGRNFMSKLGYPIIADFTLGDYISINDIRPVTRVAEQEFKEKRVRKIYLCFSQFINTLLQRPIIRQMLPIEIENFEKIVEIDQKAEKFFMRGDKGDTSRYIFEPSAEKVFNELVPHLLEVEIYKALLESSASEHSARMIAMKNATDKAGELIGDLTLAYNQARQAGITKEIAEISTGAMATR